MRLLKPNGPGGFPEYYIKFQATKAGTNFEKNTAARRFYQAQRLDLVKKKGQIEVHAVLYFAQGGADFPRLLLIQSYMVFVSNQPAEETPP